MTGLELFIILFSGVSIVTPCSTETRRIWSFLLSKRHLFLFCPRFGVQCERSSSDFFDLFERVGRQDEVGGRG